MVTHSRETIQVRIVNSVLTNAYPEAITITKKLYQFKSLPKLGFGTFLEQSQWWWEYSPWLVYVPV